MEGTVTLLVFLYMYRQTRTHRHRLLFLNVVKEVRNSRNDLTNVIILLDIRLSFLPWCAIYRMLDQLEWIIKEIPLQMHSFRGEGNNLSNLTLL